MSNKKELHEELLKLRMALALTKDTESKKLINRQINDLKKEYSKTLFKEIKNNRKGR